MSSKDIAISVRGLSKAYTIAHNAAKHTTAAEALVHRLRNPLQHPPAKETFWALKDVSFDIRRGDVLGIVGRNGAGKSTLLKILSRITEPTNGRALLHGRVASLLEVGTGFHPELTGRENIEMNGAILGMTRREILKYFDSIVEFAGVERFLDTPVKRYSSGMYVRLAFAVAAHLNPEILIVDEVLAVGDSEFQKKCLGKMGDVARQGRTVLFVSHQMPSVKALCSRVIQMSGGTVLRDGEPGSVVDQYLTDGSGDLLPERLWCREDQPGDAHLRLRALRVVDTAGEIRGTYSSSQAMIVEMEFDIAQPSSALCVGFDLINRNGVTVFRSNHNDGGERDWPALTVGRNTLKCVIPPGLLNFGKHFIAPKIGLHATAWVVNGEPEISFDVDLDHSDSPFWSVSDPNKFPGAVAPCLEWQVVGSKGAWKIGHPPNLS